MDSKKYTLKDFIRELSDVWDNHNSVFRLINWIDNVRDLLTYNYSFELDRSGSSEKIGAILNLFYEISYEKGNIEITFRRFISLLRKSKEPAIRSKWSLNQIQETVKFISYVGFPEYEIASDEEIIDSNSDSAFSSDDN